MISVLRTRECNYVLNCRIAKEVWDPLEMIYEVPTDIKREMVKMINHDFETPSEN